ncbi:testis-specific gene 10 protein isoform X1 [Pogoniulus pusillus]|uniref:testis-specific gene 10 protein isoform X1 n=1 Tax=Pogoniulus pusillus TaxID=488313 RepID=UPI0030B955D8
MSKKISSVQGVSSDPEILKILRECEELKSTLKKYERYVAEVQGNFTVLRAEREKIVSLYEQAQEEISRLRQEVIRCPRTPKSTVAVQAELRRVETERDTALSDFQRMTTERDSLREQLKISQETAFNEKAHLEQRIEELETAIENLDSERLEQMSKVALMKDTINSLETEIKRWTRRALDSEAELSQKETEYISLSLLNEKTEQNLSEAQQSLIKKKYEMQVIQEKIMILDEKIGNFSRQGLAQQEEICALKETVVQLTKEKATLQNSVEEGREKIATLEESLSIKVLYEKIAKYQNELEDMKLKAQDSNTDIVKLKGILKSKERENGELLEKYQTACERGESWEAKYYQAEADCSSVRLVLINAESENRRLKEKMELLETEMEQLRSKCKSSDSEIELLRKQLGTERASMKNLEFLLMSSHEKQFQSQRATHEKDSEIQFLKEQLSLGENKLAVQSQEFTHLRNRAAQLESELGITKRQLETEHFERERPVEELQHQTRTVSYHLRTSSPERSHLQPPDWSLEWSLDE